MRRATLTILAVAAAFVPPLGTPAISAAAAEAHVSVQFKLPAGHGLTAELENSGDQVTLGIFGRHRVVEYTVRGAVSEEGIEARFGGLGDIQVSFEPTRTLDSSEPPAGCEGEPWTTRAGFFTGVIEFTGLGGGRDLRSRPYQGEHAGDVGLAMPRAPPGHRPGAARWAERGE